MLVSQSPVLRRGVLRKLGSQVPELELGQKFKQKVSGQLFALRVKPST